MYENAKRCERSVAPEFGSRHVNAGSQAHIKGPSCRRSYRWMNALLCGGSMLFAASAA